MLIRLRFLLQVVETGEERCKLMSRLTNNISPEVTAIFMFLRLIINREQVVNARASFAPVKSDLYLILKYSPG